MKITAFNGSPWAAASNTQLMVNEFLAGASEGGAKTETVFLQQWDIRPCTGCMACQFKTPGRCKTDDEMGALLAKFVDSDVALIATPLYFDNVSSLTKLFIDRLMPLLEPHFEKDELGIYRHGVRSQTMPDLAVISGGNLPEQSHFDVLRIQFRSLAKLLHTNLVAEIYRGAGGLLANKEPRFEPALTAYRSLLRQAGAELAKLGRFTDQTIEKLEAPLVDPDNYAAYANKQWDKILVNA